MKKILLNPHVSKSFISKLKVDDIYKEIISLDDNSDYKLNKDLHIPEDTIEYCLGKKNDLINLALAKVVRDSDSLKLIYFASNDAAKHLVLSNPSIKPSFSINEKDRTFFDETTFISFISNAPEEHLMSYFMNECFVLTDLNSLFHREEPYKSISDERWTYILKIVSWNKNIKSNVDGLFGSFKYDKYGNLEDGMMWFDRTQKEDAPWELLKHLEPSNSSHLHILENLYDRVAYKVINFSLADIKSIFDKWKYNPDFDTKDHKFKEILSRIRQLLSYRICEDNERKDGLWNFFRTNEDKNLRYGYYRVYKPTLESIQLHYEKDKELFIEAGVENNNFYLTDTDEQKAITEKFREFKDKLKDNYYINSQYNYNKTTLAKSSPRYFGDLDDYDYSYNENFGKELIKNSKSVLKSINQNFKHSDDDKTKEDYRLNHVVLNHLNHSLKQQNEILDRLSNSNEINNKLNHLSKSQDNLRYLLVFVIIVLIILAFFML